MVSSPLIKRRQVLYMASSAIPGDNMQVVGSSSDYYSVVVSYSTGSPEYYVLI